MASAKEIIYNWRNLIEAGRISDDTLPSYSQLYFILNYKRAQYLRQDQTKNWFNMDTIYQDLGCLEMEEVDSAECCHFETGCTVFRTVKEIPNVIRWKMGYGLKVSAINKTKRFEIVLPERFEFIGHTRYPRLTEPVYYLNNRLYTKDIAALNVRAALVDPKDAKSFKCENGVCYTDDMEYPLPQDIVDLITRDVMGTELKYMLSLIPDEENNATDDNP